MRPKIVVTMDIASRMRREVRLPTFEIKAAYIAQIVRAGGIPILAPPTDDQEIIAEYRELMDGLVVTGGAFDIPPERFGAARLPSVRLDETKPVRTDFEWTLLERALGDNIPTLGVCGGMQLLNVVLGGTLLQDISSQVPSALPHEQSTSPERPSHVVSLPPSSPLTRVLGTEQLEVNSTHHQAVDRLGDRVVALGRAPDGVIEAVGIDGDAELRVVGVQWHPELLDDSASAQLYAHLVRLAKARRSRRVP